MAFKSLIASSFLENISHNQEQSGFEIFGHFCVADNVIDSCCKLAVDTAKKKVLLVLGTKKVKYCEAREFKNECSEYFKRYYNFLAMQKPLVLPSKVLPTNVKELLTR